jgi:hypothetical protein
LGCASAHARSLRASITASIASAALRSSLPASDRAPGHLARLGDPRAGRDHRRQHLPPG